MVYLADTLHFPYGEKTSDQVRSAVVSAIGALIAQVNPKLIVVACNTASVIALAALRRTYDLPFVGVVPAVKPAARISRLRRIGILATSRTVQDTYTERLIHDFASDCSITRVAASELVDFVERRHIGSSDSERREVVARAVAPLKKAGVDSVVLGCTHFVYLSDVVAAELGTDVQVLDSRDGVCRQVVRLLDQGGLHASETEKRQSDTFFVTGFPERPDGGGHDRYTEPMSVSEYEKFANTFGLEYSGALEPLRATGTRDHA